MQVVVGLERIVERIRLRLDGHVSSLGHVDELEELLAPAPEGGADLDIEGSRHQPDLRVAATSPDEDHRPADPDAFQGEIARRVDPDEVEDDVSASTVREIPDPISGLRLGLERLVSAHLPCERQFLVAEVKRHHPSGREGPQQLDGDMAQATGSDDDRRRPSDEAREGLAAFLERRKPGWAPQ